MKGKTSDSTQNCFSFTSGYAISLSNLCTEPFINANLGFFGASWGLDGNGVTYKPSVISYSFMSACIFNYKPKDDKPSPPNIIVGYPSLTN